MSLGYRVPFDTWSVSLGQDMHLVEQGMARATAGDAYVTYTVSPPNADPWQVRYFNIQNYLNDRFGADLGKHTFGPHEYSRARWRKMIEFLQRTPPFNAQLWPYKEFGAARRMRRPPSPVDARAGSRRTAGCITSAATLPTLARLAIGSRQTPPVASPSIDGRYWLHGNGRSDWAVASFDDYDHYRRVFDEWEREGWLRPGEQPLTEAGEPVVKVRPPPEYSFMTKGDYDTHTFSDYDKYLEAREAALKAGKLFAVNIKDARDGGALEWKNGGWVRVPYASN